MVATSATYGYACFDCILSMINENRLLIFSATIFGRWKSASFCLGNRIRTFLIDKNTPKNQTAQPCLFMICFFSLEDKKWIHYIGHCAALFFLFLSPCVDAARSGDKYETSSTNIGYSKYMKLKIRNVGPGDYGSYRCVAKNSLGETDGLIKLEGNLLIKCLRWLCICVVVNLNRITNEVSIHL